MTITKQQALDAYIAIASMGAVRPNKAVYGLTLNKGRLKTIVDAIDAQRSDLAKNHFGDETAIKNDDPRLKAFLKDRDAMLALTIEYDAVPIDATARELEADGLSPNGLEALIPFLKVEEEAQANGKAAG